MRFHGRLTKLQYVKNVIAKQAVIRLNKYKYTKTFTGMHLLISPMSILFMKYIYFKDYTYQGIYFWQGFKLLVLILCDSKLR